MRLTFGYIFAAATLASGCSATWKFKVDNHFDSQVRLVHTNGKVPMVYDEVSDQVLRVLPAKGFKHKKLEGGSADEEKASTGFPNVLQVFDEHLLLKETRSIDPKNSVATYLGAFYEPDCSSSTSTNSACSDSSSSSSSDSSSHPHRCHHNGQLETKLVSSSVGRTEVLGFPSLKRKCLLDSDLSNILRVMTAASGETYILYSDSILVMGENCEILRSHTFHEILPPKDLLAAGDCVAVDFALNETKKLLAVGFKNLYFVIFSSETLTNITGGFMFSTPYLNSTFRTMNSAMDWIVEGSVRFTLRVIIDQGEKAGIWYLAFDMSLKAKSAKMQALRGHEVVSSSSASNPSSSSLPQTPAICETFNPNPAVINDYENNLDITIGRDPTSHTLHLYITKFVGPSLTFDQVEKQCVDLCIPESVDCGVAYWYAVKKAHENVFFINFAPSLDMLRISYEYVDNVRN